MADHEQEHKEFQERILAQLSQLSKALTTAPCPAMMVWGVVRISQFADSGVEGVTQALMQQSGLQPTPFLVEEPQPRSRRSELN